MAKYIDAEKIEYPYMTMSMWGLNSKDCHAYNEGVKAVEDKISAIPSADVVEVKHGHWKLLIFKGGRRSGQAEAKCSICGRDAVYQITEEKWEFENYCPHCGAKMDGEHNER